jgi:oligopeptide/dipeptide ABC transporter ATP-binding protein
MDAALLDVERLTVHFPVRGGFWRRPVGVVHAVDDVSFTVQAGETLGLVGESGCGKTTVGRAVVRLLRPSRGRVRFDGLDLANAGGRRLKRVRRQLQIIFQDPLDSLDARQTVREILEEPFAIHGIGSAAERRREVLGLLERVGLPAAGLERYPHEFSGGQRQRIGIARAIALGPRLVVCDEPVSALDVSIQSQILNLLLRLQAEMGLAYLFIAHDLAVVKHVSDRIAVMYLGKLVELAAADDLYTQPLHPYTRALIAAIPIPEPQLRRRSVPLGGEVPSPLHPPAGCRFHTRCPIAIDRCRVEEPVLRPYPIDGRGVHHAACHRAGEVIPMA